MIRPTAWRPFLAVLFLLLVAAAPLALAGCRAGQGGQLKYVAIGDESGQIDPAFETLVFKPRAHGGATIVLSDLSREALVNGDLVSGHVLCIDLFVRPKAGASPIDPAATNATFRHVILADQEAVGVYGGGGFVNPGRSWNGSSSLSGSVMGGSMELIESTDDFLDRLGAIEIRGRFSAVRDDRAIEQVALHLNSEVTRRLGYVHFVMSH